MAMKTDLQTDSSFLEEKVMYKKVVQENSLEIVKGDVIIGFASVIKSKKICNFVVENNR